MTGLTVNVKDFNSWSRSVILSSSAYGGGMGLYIRKSISVGPVRFNLSKTGIGVSAGIKGLRLGTGPRGTYVHMGRGGLYYRKTLSSNNNQALSKTPNGESVDQITRIQGGTHAPLEEIESGTVFAMTDSDSEELLNELNSKRKKIRLWPIMLTFGLIIAAFSSWSLYAFAFMAFVTGISYYFDVMRKTVVLFYDLESDIQPAYEALIHAIDEIGGSEKIWHVEAQGAVYDKKYHAGAAGLQRRSPTSVSKVPPSFVKTNIDVSSIAVGKQVLFFFPDRLLVFENNAVGAVSYRDLGMLVFSNQFIEEDPVPKDARVVGRTWRYVNKDGGPDRRFSNNREIPIVEYGYIGLSSKTGLEELVCLSRTDKGQYLKKAVYEISRF